VTDRALAERLWGARDAAGGYAWQKLEAAGAVLAFGSDVPIEPLDPRGGLHAAVTGDPVRALTLDRAFAAFTVGGAIACGRGNELGRIAQGSHADFVVWEDDPWAVPLERLREVGIAQTWVGGERVV
jgi:predicted amidohydrolase YtcJ